MCLLIYRVSGVTWGYCPTVIWIFSYFEFKIKLIRLDLSFQKYKWLYLNSQPTDFQSEVITIISKSQLRLITAAHHHIQRSGRF